MNIRYRSFRFIHAVGLAFVVTAAATLPSRAADGTAAGNMWEQRVLGSRTYLNAHPDLKHRTEGWFAYEAGDHARAMAEFRSAARYADKLSQAMVAELLWQGLGVERDRPAAYAWADLAAERGYPQFVQLREQYWRQLDADERARASEVGRSLQVEYADVSARPRMAEFLRKAQRRDRQSSMYLRPQEVSVPDRAGRASRVPGHIFHAQKYWDPVQYQAWQDSLWMPPREGEVSVGDVEQVEAPAD
jgi:hypothetical protein